MEYALSELFTLQMGKTPSRDNSSYWKKSENNWISIADLTNSGKYISNTKETLSDSAVAESGIKKIPANTVIMSFKLSLGKVAITEKEMYSNEAIMAFIDKGVEKISPEYLYYLLRAKDWSKGTNKAVMGATLNKATLSTIKIQLHEYDNQLEIVNMLNRVSSSIDFRKQQLTKLDELIKARFVEMFENNTYPKVKVSTVCDFITKGTTPPNDLISEEYSSDKVPYLKVYNLSFNGELLFDTAPQYISENIHNGMLARSKVYPNDVLMNIVGPPLGKFSLVTDEFPEWNINQAIAIFRAKEKINPKYLLSALMQPEVLNPFLRQAVGIRQLNLSLSQCRDLEIFLPPLSLQNQFADFVAEVDKSKLLAGSAAAHKPFDIGFFSQKHCATPCKRGIISSKHVIFH